MKHYTIDFTKYKNTKNTLLKESFVAEWAADLKYILSHILSPGAIRTLEEEDKEEKKITIKGDKEDIAAFSNVLGQEKKYALEYMESGLGSPQLSDIKLELEKSIHNFEKTTGLIWPLR